MTLIIMQLVVGPALGKLSAGPEKDAALAVIQGRWRPVIDTTIVILTITALYLLITKWGLIAFNPLLLVKISFGLMTLFLANLLHFYFRGVKRRLTAKGKTDSLADINRLTLIMERVALVTGAITFLLGLTFNHILF